MTKLGKKIKKILSSDKKKPLKPIDYFTITEDQLPLEFGRYELRKILGSGGMGKVFLAFDRKLNLEVTLKIPAKKIVENETNLKRFYYEAQILAKLHHPNMCRIFDVGEIEGHPYLTMSFINGAVLKGHGTLPVDRSVDLTRSIALAMAEAHKSGIVHRDLKPANIIIDQAGKPIVIDFGIAFDSNLGELRRLTNIGEVPCTPIYASPEQLSFELHREVGPPSDIFTLGIIFLELLTQVLLPTTAIQGVQDREDHIKGMVSDRLPSQLIDIYLKATQIKQEDRYASMEDFAKDLEHFLDQKAISKAVTIKPECVSFEYGLFGKLQEDLSQQDYLYLEMGGQLRTGVIDQHQNTTSNSCTAGLVLDHPEFVKGCIKPWRQPDGPFTIIMHPGPDLDCILSAFLSISLLTTGKFPALAQLLTAYVEQIDSGAMGMSVDHPFSLYSAHMMIGHRLSLSTWPSKEELWDAIVKDTFKVIEYVHGQLGKTGASLLEIDAFQTPGLFRKRDREELLGDHARYLEKLSSPNCFARQAQLKLPGQMGGQKIVDTLLVRNVQDQDDEERCIFFKDWARSDKKSPNGNGYAALSVYMFEEELSDQGRRCIISVKPYQQVHLKGLGEKLEQAEAGCRKSIYGFDDRVKDVTTLKEKEKRPGFDNADPWYDGRGHQYTIVDSPRSGTRLTIEEIESILLEFGGLKNDSPDIVPLYTSTNAE